MTIFKTALAALPQIIVASLVLAGIGILAATNHITPANAFALVMLIIGATGVAAGLVLGNLEKPNAAVIIHAVIALLVLALAVVLTLRNIFTETEILGVITVLLGSGVTAAVSQSNSPQPVVGNLGAPVIVEPPADAPPAI